MEGVIKATCGSPGGIFFAGFTNKSYNYSMKKNSKGSKNKKSSSRSGVVFSEEDPEVYDEQETILQNRILNGTEVEEWLESP